MRNRVAPVRHAAKIEALAQDGKAERCAIHAYSAEAEVRTTVTTGVRVVGAAETFVRGDEALVEADGGEDEVHHLKVHSLFDLKALNS